MKKVLAAMVLTALLIALTAMAYAAAPGDTVTVPVSVNANPGNAVLGKVSFSFDSSVLEFVSASGANGWTKPGNANGNFGYISEGDPIPVGEIGSLVFKVKSNAAPGTYPINVSVARAMDANDNNVSLSISGGSITIEKKDDETKTDPTPTDAPPCTHPKTVDIVVEEPTCTQEGLMQTFCATCDFDLKSVVLPPLGHDYVEQVSPATCEEEGIKTSTCSRCGDVKTEKIPALGHDGGKWVTVKNATKEAEGLKQLQCTRCGAVLKEEAIPKIVSDWQYNNTVSTKGIRYRDIKPELTEKWYMFTPMDLSQDGVYTYDLLVGNIRVAGTVTVTVLEGKVTVEYKLNRSVNEREIGFTFLPDLESVTDVEAIDYSKYEFGKEISIADDLGGDTKVLLQVFGHVDVDYASSSVGYFWTATQEYRDLVEELKGLMD